MRGRKRKPEADRAEGRVIAAIKSGSQTYLAIEVATKLSRASVRAATKLLVDQGCVGRYYRNREVKDKLGMFTHQASEPVFSYIRLPNDDTNTSGTAGTTS